MTIVARNPQPAARAAAPWTLLCAGLLLGACAAPTSLVNLWKDPDAPRQPLRNVLVVSMRKDPTTRRIWEDGFVRELDARGVSATPSYRLYPDAVPDTDAVESAIHSHGFDGVISIRRLPTRTERQYVPGYTSVRPYARYSPWTGFYHERYVEVFNPGYTETDKIVRFQVDVWSAAAEEGLVWSGTTETIDPTSTSEVNRELSHLIVPELGSSGVLAVKGSAS